MIDSVHRSSTAKGDVLLSSTHTSSLRPSEGRLEGRGVWVGGERRCEKVERWEDLKSEEWMLEGR